MLGCNDDSREQGVDGGELDETTEVGEQLVVAGGDAAELPQSVEGALGAVALLVEGAVVSVRPASVPAGWNGGFGSGVEDGVVQVVGVVSWVGDDRIRIEPFDQLMGMAISLSCPGPNSRRTGLPRASVAAWILALRPSRERLNPWACAPLRLAGHRPRAGHFG